MKQTKYLLFALLLPALGCVKKNDLNFKNLQYTNWTPDWALPFISSTLTMRNMLNSNTVVATDPSSGLISLHYYAKGFTFKAADIFIMPDQHFATPAFSLSTPIVSLPVGATTSDSMANNFSYADGAGGQLSHIGLKAGTFHISLVSTFSQNVSLQIVFPNIQKSGAPLTLPVNISYPASTSDASIDLSGYILDLTNGGTARNYMAYKINFTLTGTGQPIASGSNLVANVDFTGLKFGFIDGTLGHYEIPIPNDSINIGILNKSISANIRLLNPKLHVAMASSFGVSVGATFDSLYGYQTSGARDTINVPPLLIAGATSTTSPMAQSTYIIDSTNSTLRNIFSPVPNYIVYNGHASINPTGSTAYNFVTDTSSIIVALDAELPACFQILQLALQDTIMMQMPPDTTMLAKAQFAVQVTNAFPVYASVQLYFTDSNYVVLDSLITPTTDLIPPAPVDANGIVRDSTSQVTNFLYERNRYMLMASRVRHGIIRGNLLTSGTGSIQMHATDHLKVKTAIRFTLDYNL